MEFAPMILLCEHLFLENRKIPDKPSCFHIEIGTL